MFADSLFAQWAHFCGREGLFSSKRPRKKRFWQQQQGLTALEMVVAMGIVGILAAMTSIGLAALAPKFNLDNSARQVAMALSQARIQAITRGHAIDIAFAADSFAITDPADGDELLAEGELPSGITVDASDTVTFTPLGTTAAPLTVTVSNSDGSRAVSVGLTGEVQIL
jgi:prepilin-type N-terminal cleavage/methylation domain-containing protein